MTTLPIVAIALVTFVLFKVLSLFVAPANVVLCFLAVGHPVGVLIGARFYADRPERALRHFFVVVCWSILALTLLRSVTPPLAPPWISGGYPLGDVVKHLAVYAVAFTPLFVGSGVVEYLVLSRVAAGEGGSGRAYAVLLGGTLAGLVLGYALLSRAGALGLLALAIACAAAATLRGTARSLSLGVGFVACALCAAFPSLDAAFVVSVSPGGRYTARGMLDDGATLLRASWDRQSYTQVLSTADQTSGAYDDLVYWDVWRDVALDPRSDDDLVYQVLPRASRVAIIGVGGGRQLQQALALDRGLTIDAFEINETIVQHYQAHPESNGGAFLAPGVQVFARDGRRGVLERPPYDCIYLPEAGTVLGYYRTLAIDLNFLHTADAYRGYASRLREHGMIASAFASYADPGNYVTRRVAASFREMGLAVRAYATSRWAVVLGTRPGEAEAMLRAADEIARARGIAALPEADTRARETLPSDDAGLSLLLALAPRARLRGAFLGAGLAALVACGLQWLALSRRARRRLARQSASETAPPALVGASLLAAMGLGASYLLVENAVILNLARRMWTMADAVIVGSAAFLACAVAGAAASHLLRARRSARAAQLALLALGLTLVLLAPPESALVLAGTLVLSVASGTFFPQLLDARGPALLPYVYACDGLGALLGTVLVFFVPLLSGIGALTQVAALACAAMGASVLSLTREGARAGSPADTRRSGHAGDR